MWILITACGKPPQALPLPIADRSVPPTPTATTATATATAAPCGALVQDYPMCPGGEWPHCPQLSPAAIPYVGVAERCAAEWAVGGRVWVGEEWFTVVRVVVSWEDGAWGVASFDRVWLDRWPEVQHRTGQRVRYEAEQ